MANTDGRSKMEEIGLDEIDRYLKDVAAKNGGKGPEFGLPGFIAGLYPCVVEMQKAKRPLTASREVAEEIEPPHFAEFFGRGGAVLRAFSLLYERAPQFDMSNLYTIDPAAVNRLSRMAECLVSEMAVCVIRLYVGLPVTGLFNHLTFFVMLYSRWSWNAEVDGNDPRPLAFWFELISGEFEPLHYNMMEYELDLKKREANPVAIRQYVKNRQDRELPDEEGNVTSICWDILNGCEIALSRNTTLTELAAYSFEQVALSWKWHISATFDFFAGRTKDMPVVRLMEMFLPDRSFRRAFAVLHRALSRPDSEFDTTMQVATSPFSVVADLIDLLGRIEFPEKISVGIECFRGAFLAYRRSVASAENRGHFNLEPIKDQFKDICTTCDTLAIEIGSYELALFNNLPAKELQTPVNVVEGEVIRPDIVTLIQKLLSGQVRIIENQGRAAETQGEIYKEQLRTNTRLTALGNKVDAEGATLRNVRKTVKKIYDEQESGGRSDEGAKRGPARQCPEMVEDAIRKLRGLYRQNGKVNLDQAVKTVFDDKTKKYRRRYRKWSSFRVVMSRAWKSDRLHHPNAKPDDPID